MVLKAVEWSTMTSFYSEPEEYAVHIGYNFTYFDAFTGCHRFSSAGEANRSRRLEQTLQYFVNYSSRCNVINYKIANMAQLSSFGRATCIHDHNNPYRVHFIIRNAFITGQHNVFAAVQVVTTDGRG